MPSFPVYPDDLPRSLSPLNFRHYLLLTYWVFFSPTLVKLYLYQLDPELYETTEQTIDGTPTIRRILAYRSQVDLIRRNKEYRNLFLMVPAIMLFFFLVLALPVLLTVDILVKIPIDWLEVVGVVTSTLLLAILMTVLAAILFGVLFSVAIGVAVGAPWIVVFSIAYGMAGSLAGSVAGSIVAGVALGIVFGGGVSVAMSAAVDVVLGIVIGVVFGAIMGLGGGLVGLREYFDLSFQFSVTDSVLGSVLGLTAGVASALRVHFYLLELALLTSHVSLHQYIHPVEWDENTIFPLPGTERVLAQSLQTNQQKGLILLSQIARNPFRRAMAQRVLQAYIHNNSLPLHLFNNLLIDPIFNVYAIAPVKKSDWNRIPSIRELFLREITGIWVDLNQPADHLMWRLTYRLRDRRKTPLTRYSKMLVELLNEAWVESKGFDLAIYSKVYTNLQDYPGGQEIAYSFQTMAAFLDYRRLTDLATAIEVIAKLTSPCDSLYSSVLTAVNRLGAIGAEVSAYQAATSRVNRQAALLRATDTLDSLAEHVAAEVRYPELSILKRIIGQWRRLISEEGGKLGSANLPGPVPNPYVLNNPVQGELFVGRDDILRELEELWAKAGQVPSVVLYGHRRMGKSSIIHNLGPRFGTGTQIVDFNLQRVGRVTSTGELLYNLALALYDTLPSTAQHILSEPEEVRFTVHNPTLAFDRFLKEIDRVRNGIRFIVTIDEFELIEEQIIENKIDFHLLTFWRGLIQTYPWFVMAFAGLHDLAEMTEDYWHPLFGSVNQIKVSFLSPNATRRLITEPSPDFSIDYDTPAIERIIELTNGQPFLVQLIGHTLVTRFNRQTFEGGVDHERRFLLTDVEAAIDASEFNRNGNAYFAGIWGQAERSVPPGQTTILQVLSSKDLTLDKIVEATDLPIDQVDAALLTLIRHDVVAKRDGKYSYTVELMRRWVARRTDLRITD